MREEINAPHRSSAHGAREPTLWMPPALGPTPVHLLSLRRHAATTLGVAVAITAPLALWLNAVHVDEGPGWIARLVATALYVGVVATILYTVLGLEGSQRAWYVAGLGGLVGVAAVGSGVLTSAGTLLVAGTMLVALHLLLLWRLGRGPRTMVRRFLPVLAVWVVGIAVFAAPAWVSDLETLVWERSDQFLYYRLSDSLLFGEAAESRFQLGFPAMLAPALLVAGTVGSRSLVAANTVNLFVLPVFTLLVGTAWIYLCVRVITLITATREGARTTAVAAALVVAVLLFYILLPPEYVPERNAALVPLRLLGLVYGPEPVGFFYMAFGLWLLAGGRPRWNPVLLGLLTSVAVAVREFNAVVAVALFALLLTVPGTRLRTLLAGVISLVAYLPQLWHFHQVYGSWLFPQRARAWTGGRGVSWLETAAERYGFEGQAIPPQISMRYVPVNLPETLLHYGPTLLLFAVATAFLFLTCKHHWRVWTFAAVFAPFTVVFHSAYINPVVTFRYNAVILPVAAVVLGTAAFALPARLERRGRRRPRSTSPGSFGGPFPYPDVQSNLLIDPGRS